MYTLEDFYHDYNEKLTQYCSAKMSRRMANPDVQDVVGATYLMMQRYWDRCRATDPAGYYAWSKKIAYREFLKAQEKAQRHYYFEPDIIANLATDSMNPYSWSTALELLNPPKEIHDIATYRAMGYTLTEIAGLLKVHPNTIKYRVKQHVKPWAEEHLD